MEQEREKIQKAMYGKFLQKINDTNIKKGNTPKSKFK
jgi:hypothetical protein